MDVRFGMIFTSLPDFGGIERSGKGFILMSDDLSRLTTDGVIILSYRTELMI